MLHVYGFSEKIDISFKKNPQKTIKTKEKQTAIGHMWISKTKINFAYAV